MQLSKWCAVLACVAVLGCGPSGRVTSQQRRVELGFIEGRVESWSQILNNGDLDSLLTMYHDVPDLTTVWTDGSRAAGFEDHEQVLRAYWETIEHLNFVVQSPEVQVLSPDVAVVTFRHSTDVQFKEGGRETYAGHGTIVWMKDAEDGLWKIHTQHVSRNPS